MDGSRVRSTAHRSLIVALVSMLCVTVTTALAAGERRAFTVNSTLTGKKVLPHRIAWTAIPKPASVVDRVDFLIDGKLSWVERHPPYTYGGDGNWLVTSWLAPGQHRFSVRAVSSSGRKAAKTTIAEVVVAPDPPVELANTRWERTLTHDGSDGSPAGRWVLSIDKVGWSVLDPDGYTNVIDVAYPSLGSVDAYGGGIWMRPADSTNVGGNGWCRDKPRATMKYQWTVAGDTLTLMLAGPKGCGDQDEVLAATWTRVR